eukprot:scaffold90429_cov23-Tisochrysis_lutea.AAC.4
MFWGVFFVMKLGDVCWVPTGRAHWLVWLQRIAKWLSSTGADMGCTRAHVGSTGADVGSIEANVGGTGAGVGSTGAKMSSSGANVGGIGAAEGSKAPEQLDCYFLNTHTFRVACSKAPVRCTCTCLFIGLQLKGNKALGGADAEDTENPLLDDLMSYAEVMVASFDAVRRLLLAAPKDKAGLLRCVLSVPL